VSAGQFIPTGQRPNIDFIPGAFIIEVCLAEHCYPYHCTRAPEGLQIYRSLNADFHCLLSQFQDGFDYTKSGIFLNVKIGLSFDVRHQYSIFNGISIQFKSGHTGDDLAAMEGVKRVWPVELFRSLNRNLRMRTWSSLTW
jgi:hypothetical protein